MTAIRDAAAPILAALLLSAATGCALNKVIERPEVSVKGVTVTRAGLSSADASFALAVHNPNGFELDLHGVNYDLTVNGRRLVSGDSAQELRLPANGGGQIDLPVRLEYQRIFDSLSELARSRRVVYQLSGSVGVGPFRIPFASGGEFALEQ